MTIRFSILALSLWLACTHARSVAPPQEPSSPEVVEEKPTPKKSSVPREDGDIRISSSPEALLEPSAARAIQDRLAKSGDLEGEPSGELDGPTRKALARFQRAHDLPATGAPDDATVRKLGLDPKDVFRAGR